MTIPVRILFVEPQPTDAELAEAEIRQALPACTCRRADSLSAFTALLPDFQPDLILTAYQLPDGDALRLLQAAATHAPQTPVIVLTCARDEATAVACMKAGAVDYLTKDRIAELGTAVRAALQEKERRIVQQKESEFFLQKFQSVAQIGSFVIDIATGEFTIPEFLAEITGVDDDYPRNFDGWLAMVRPDYREQVWQHLSQHMLTAHNRYEDVYPIIRPNDRQERWIHTLGEIERDENGQAVRLIGTAQDITERKRAEDALQLTRFSINHVADAVYWINQDAQVVDVNETACRMLGYTRQEFLSFSLKDFDPNFDPDQWSHYWEILEQDKTLSLETTHHTKDGRTVPVEIISNFIEFNDQKLNCSIARDITRRRTAEQQLRESEERLQKFSSVTTEGIFFHYQSIIQDVNEALVAMLGYEPDEMIGREMFEFVPQEEHELIRQKVQNREVTPYETLAKRKDGSVFPIETAALSFAYRGKTMRVVRVRDITERKQIEQERLENLKFFENMDAISRAIQGSSDIQEMMRSTLDEVLSIFGCDRAFLMHPADPEAPFIQVPMERTTAEYPGAFILDQPIPVTPEFRKIVETVLNSDAPSTLVTGKNLNGAQEPWKSFGVKSVMATAVHPRVGKPWAFGIHQCSHAKEWSSHEQKLFQEISRRLSDALTTMLFYRDLQESKQRYQEAQEIAQLGHWSFDPYHAQFLWWSEETFRLLGLDPALGSPDYQTFIAQVHPDDHAHIEKRLARTLRDGAPFLIEYRVPLADGNVRILEARGVIHRNAAQQIELLSGTVMNITERRQAEERLLYQANLLQNVSDAIVATDMDSIIISWNKAAERLYGWSADEAVGQHILDMIPTEIIDEAPDLAMQTLFGEGQWEGEAIQKHRDGSNINVFSSASLIRDSAGQSTGVVAVNRDVTERKRAEAALLQSEERLKQAVHVAGIGTFDHDHLTDDLYLSPELRQMWGYDSEEEVTLAAGMHRLHPDDRERIREALARAHSPAGDGYYQEEQRVIHPDESVHWQSVRAQTFFAGEGDARRPVRTVGAVLDITGARLAEKARAELEEQLRQAQKLESLGRLAGGIAHDFNNLLVPLIGYTELGQMMLPKEDKVHGYFEKIGTAAKRAANLTKQILAFSRRQMLEIGLFDLNDIVGGFEEMLQRLIGENIQMQLFLAPTPCLINADRTQIEQILLNLAINARDAMLNGGQLTLETDIVYLDESYAQTHPETEPGRYTMLSISDTGHGMDSETQRQIFEPFFTTKERGKGTGLGLATVFGIVKQHGGNIWVYSEPDQGTTFKIYLPQPKDVNQLDAAAAVEMPSVYGSETILVVEDEPMVRKLACETLAAYGYTVLEADSPEVGLQIAAAHETKIHLLLTDVIMPEMNGRQLYNKIIQIRPDIKVLYMSGYTDNVIVHHGVLDEGINFLEKPFTIRRFGQKVRRVLDS